MDNVLLFGPQEATALRASAFPRSWGTYPFSFIRHYRFLLAFPPIPSWFLVLSDSSSCFLSTCIYKTSDSIYCFISDFCVFQNLRLSRQMPVLSLLVCLGHFGLNQHLNWNRPSPRTVLAALSIKVIPFCGYLQVPSIPDPQNCFGFCLMQVQTI